MLMIDSTYKYSNFNNVTAFYLNNKGISRNARIMIIHVCFIAITVAGSLGGCLNTFLQTRQMLMHEQLYV